MATQTIIARRPDGLAFYTQGAEEPTHVVAGTSVLLDPKGRLIAATTPDTVDIWDASGTNKIRSLPAPNTVLAALSPDSNYLVTCSKPVKDAAGQPGKNLQVWDLSSGEVVQAVPQKQVSKEHWPAIHWAGDESAFAHCVTNTAQLYAKKDNFATYRRVTIKGVTGVALSPATSGPALAYLGAFIPEAKGSPASAGIYNWMGEGPSEPQAMVRKSFFRTQGAKLLWNKSGSALLVLAYTDFDVTNQSYYGEQKLHYLPSDPAHFDKATTVDLKDGPVHDVQWSPSGEHFAVVAGFLPSRVMLFDAYCKPLYDFGSGPYSTVRWNPFGRFLIVAGFGNLPGDIVFFDRKASGTCKQMGAVRSPSVTAEWSPDGRHLLTATTAPRMRVDNVYKVFTYYGQQVQANAFPTLFEAAWVPSPPGTYQDRPQSPERLAAAAASPSGSGPAPAAQQGPVKTAGYVPPHLRGAGGGRDGGASRPQFSLAYDANDRPGRVTVGASGAIRPASAKPSTPGAEFAPVTKATSKNAKKRANKKKADGTAGGEQGDAADADGDGNGDGPTTGPASTPAAASGAAVGSGGGGVQGLAQAVAGLSTQDTGEAVSSGDDKAKRVRALQKKLRQIAELQEKAQKEGKALTPEQKQKVQGQADILAELQSLGATP